MIWHIFRKDLRLLWPLAAFAAGVQFLDAGLLIAGGEFARSSNGEMGELGWISNIALPGVALLGLVVLTMAAIQQDALPGTTQDWLTRPIPRSRLFLAKLLFVALTGLLPILAADLAMGLAAQLRLADVIAGSFTRSGVLLCLVCVPAALIGAVTRTLSEALVLVVAVGVALIIEFITFAQMWGPRMMIQSGYGWIVAPILICLNLAALLILVPLQLRWRSTNRVRWILAAYFCLLPTVAFIPWNAAFQMHRTVGSGNIAAPVSIALDTNRRVTFTNISNSERTVRPAFVTLTVPVVISNLGPGNRVFVDRIKLRSINPQRAGTKGGSSDEDLSQINQLGFILDRAPDPSGAAPEILLTIPFDEFNAARAAQARIEVQLLATKLRLTAEMPLQSLAAVGSIDDHGRCSRESIVRSGRRSEVNQCVSARPIGNCVIFKDPSRRLSEFGMNAYLCGTSSYSPWPLPLWRDAYYASSLGAAYDGRQAIRADSSSEAAKGSNVIVLNYVIDAHLVRTLDFQAGSAIEKASIENRSADGVGPAARFALPAGVVADRRGNLFIVDEADSVIRKVTPGGEVVTFAGMAREKGRNDGVAQDARFNAPRGIAIDNADNLFVADTGNGLIRKITPGGIVSTIMGISGAKGSRAEPLRFKNPRGVVCAPDGSLYVIDSNAVANGNPVVRKVSPVGVLSTLAGPDEPAGRPDNVRMTVPEE